MHKNNRVLKAGIWYTISNFLIKGLVFITMPIFTRLMTKNDIGLFSNITSWFTIFSIVATFELYSSLSVARFDYRDDLDSYISSNLVLGTIITFIFYIIFLIFHDFFESIFMIDFITMNIIFIYLLFYPSIQMYQLKNQFVYNYKSTVFISMISAITSTGLSVLLVLLSENKLMGRTIGYFLPLIVISLVVYIILIKNSKKIVKEYWKYALGISIPLIVHLLAGYLLNSSDKIMITKMISPEANALYSVAYTLSMVVSLLWNSMNNAWSPWAYEQMDKKHYEKLKRNSKSYSLFFLGVIFLFMLVTPELLYIMGGKEYMEAKYVLPPVMTGYIFQFVYSLYVNIEFYHKKQKNIALGTIIATIVNIILNYIFIPIFGYIVAAYTTLIGYIVLFIIHYLFVKKLKCTSWYDTKFFVTLLVVSIIYMLICNIIFTFNICRYIIILIEIILFIYIMLKNKNEILNLLKIKKEQ